MGAPIMRPALPASHRRLPRSARAASAGSGASDSAEMTAMPSAPAAITARGIAGVDAGDAADRHPFVRQRGACSAAMMRESPSGPIGGFFCCFDKRDINAAGADIVDQLDGRGLGLGDRS